MNKLTSEQRKFLICLRTVIYESSLTNWYDTINNITSMLDRRAYRDMDRDRILGLLSVSEIVGLLEKKGYVI